MNEGIHLDLDTWIVPGQIRKANLCRGWETDTHQPVPSRLPVYAIRNSSIITCPKWGVKQGDPLGTDHFGVVIEIISELMKVIAPIIRVAIQ